MIDWEGMLALNQAHEQETSVLDMAALRALADKARHVGVHGAGRDAFLIAMDQESTYAGHHFAWFKQRYDRFLYVDRIVVGEAARGQGVGRRLYEELFRFAVERGQRRIACEVNKSPPNPGSDAFHERLGFAVVGEGLSADGTKTVRYMLRALDPTPPA